MYSIEVWRGATCVFRQECPDKARAKDIFKFKAIEHIGLFERYEIYLLKWLDKEHYNVLYCVDCCNYTERE